MEARKTYLKLNDIEAYTSAFKLSNYIWEMVVKWDVFAKDTLGKQFVRAADSISANIAEGFGRHSKKDKIRFYRISRGSVYETMEWNEKSKIRKLISDIEYTSLNENLMKLPKLLNQLIKYTNTLVSD
ncbi:MAG: four helix bundle protein [Bacteroidales bacterium]|nr:four helix bundle protein [Bacteroidales bacterium]MCF8352762.1 four helix bundle protein [Bacteroidales bacterium]MCF8376931.1 four helix bundle protein [Bacteroidales bacterium]MCF8400800.1 four helix bundle protein [Bacteroidales bacterium]